MFDKLGFEGEPMPDFETRYPGKLESCLETPFGKYDAYVFYRGLLKKAVALFYFCIKDHPFENGNKRFAVAIFMYFLVKNNHWLTIAPEELYRIAKHVADDNESKPQEVIALLYKTFKPFLKTMPIEQ